MVIFQKLEISYRTRGKDTQQVKTKYEIVATNATPFGGAYVLSEFLKQIRFHELFDCVFSKLRRVRAYTPAETIALLIALIVEGGERLYDIEQFADDPAVAQLFQVDSIPQDTTLRDDLLLVGHQDQRRQELLFRLNELLFEKLHLKSLTIDIDATALPVDGHQEGAEKGYCPEEPGSRCFQSLKAICDETETVIAETTMPGNTHCAKGIVEFVTMLLERLVPHFGTITLHLRLDAGFYSDELLSLIESYENVIYEIAVPQHGWLQQKVTTLAYRPYHHSERHYSGFAYGGGLTGAFRYYSVERTATPLGTQLELFASGQYRYRVLLSNRRRQPHTVFRHYQQRGRVEKHIEELKNQYALGKMVSGSFAITRALAWVSHLAFTIMGMLRRVAFGRQIATYRLRRLRFLLFSAIGYFAEHAGDKKFKIALPRVRPAQFAAIMHRIWAF
jgi:hypothetical protein